MGVLYLAPLYSGAPVGTLRWLGQRLEHTFGLAVATHPPGFDLEEAFDASRGQYNSRVFLGQLLEHAPPDMERILGVTGVDLFMPVLTYVFGEAQLDGPAAVVSMYRLDNALYGLPPDPELLRERLCREAVHELGHTYGLLHCRDDRCVMASSTYVEQIDLKRARFCARCAGALRRRDAS